MPIYEFKCRDCGKEFEEIVLGSDETVTCPECRSTATQQLISRCGFKTGGGAPASGGEDAAPKPQYRGIGSGSGCAGCSGGNCSSCG
ncbi:MAG: zinc ribbon domain-containing protein [Desulfovibrio sp.]|jgi:putative FmdB family regulatory protein|nr:zinc ribbon domain-containing protein [Desulfovibrio sp.]